MAKVIDFRKGTTFHTAFIKSTFVKDLKKILKGLNLISYDTCCDAENTRLPVSYNAETYQIEFFDGTEWVNSEGGLIHRAGSEINATATATAEQVVGGLITSTSAAPTNITLPTATAIGALLNADKGTTFQFIIDNYDGEDLVTVVIPGMGGIVVKSALTGGDDLEVLNGDIGIFNLYFVSTAVAIISRIV